VQPLQGAIISQFFRFWYIKAMSKEQVKAILDRVLTWPEQRQEDAAKVLMLIEPADESVDRLTDDRLRKSAGGRPIQTPAG
jgi:hypothetical protein